MDERKIRILKAIIKHFVHSADPVGSQFLLDSGDFQVSSATIRNDMAYLESIGLIAQPYTSAGRVPTEKGFRMFVDEFMDEIPEQSWEKQKALLDIQQLQEQQLDIRVRSVVSIISKLTECVGFVTLPWMNDAYYLGISHVLKTPEFQDSLLASTVVEVLEDKDQFIKTLSQLEIDRSVRAYIGEENVIFGIHSCSLLVTMYERGSYRGAVGILGPTRMNYAYNIKVLEKLRSDIEL